MDNTHWRVRGAIGAIQHVYGKQTGSYAVNSEVKILYEANKVLLGFREQIRQGLEELQKVLPGGDTYMHEGFERVISGQFSTLQYKASHWDTSMEIADEIKGD